MKFALLSDLHGTTKIPVGRLDNVFETFDRKLSFVLDYVIKNKCVILQAGDLSDSSRNWDILDYYISKLAIVTLYSVFGQHDLYNRADAWSTPTTLLTLIRAGVVKLLGKEPVCIGDVRIYGANWKSEIPFPGSSAKNILVLHAPISKKAEWEGHDFTHPRYFLKKHYRYDLVLTGDIHREFNITYKGQHIINTGPMLRLEANEYNFKHKPCFYVWDSNTLEVKRINIPHEPAEKVLTREHIETKKLSQKELDTFSLELKNMQPLTDMRKKKIQKYLGEKIKDKIVKEIVMEIINEY